MYICLPLAFCYCRLPAKFMASVKPPLDKHSQNLTLHCIELQHHKRRMRLMLMAAQHQHGEGGVSLFIIDFFVQYLSNNFDAFDVFSFIVLSLYHPLFDRLSTLVIQYLSYISHLPVQGFMLGECLQQSPYQGDQCPVFSFIHFIISMKTSSYQTNLFFSEVRGC